MMQLFCLTKNTNRGLLSGLLPLVSCCVVGSLACSANDPAHREANEAPTKVQLVREEKPAPPHVLTGEEALGDWTTDAPGVRRRLTLNDLPAPYATRSIDNGPHMIPRPEGAWPKAPNGFKVTEYLTGLENPRQMATAPNGDVFVVESDPGRVKVLRDTKGAGKPDMVQVYATGLVKPFGVTFYPPGPNPQYLYIGNTDSVVRFPYRNGDLQARSPEETMVPNLPGGGRLRGGGHWTRDVKFSKDGKRMFVSVGSLTNVHERNFDESRRADILEFTPDGKNERIFASGIRNAVSLAIHPTTGEVWASVNERDGLGDQLVPDYITHVQDGGFYGWPWFYMGGHPDERAVDPKPELKNKVITPDVLLQSHSASLGMIFYTGAQFPKEYAMDAFASEHGSWNRARRTGYKVIRVPLKNGKATGEYEDFLIGFVTSNGEVWGRPVGVTQAKDGALLVSDDGSGTIWRVAYTGAK
ncbi:MAG TPA: sorbosone dehydrogenase family protein [Chthonomonadaceae bacterium]|nr:sorbosone dehydrogenase family protein [Chthonomonadaceae bacterium]